MVLNFQKMWQDRYDPSFGSQFHKRITPGYQTLLNKMGLSPFQIEASAIHGFHFSLVETEVLNPRNDKLYLFPNRPTKYDLEEIAVLTATESGWANRKITITPQYPIRVFCYEIHPSEVTAETRVEVYPNSKYGTSGLEGIEVRADTSLIWNVKDRKLIIVENDKATLI